MRLGDWIWKRGGRNEDLQLACPLPSTEWSVSGQGMLVGVRGWNKAIHGGKEVWSDMWRWRQGVKEAASGGLLQSWG